jgi:predicted dehydrogenase
VKNIKIAVVGLGFGSAFVPIYQAHPDVAEVGICDADPVRLNAVGDEFGITRRHSSLEEVLAHDYDAIHLLTPVPLHVEQTLAILHAGMHCACAVPMATDLDDLRLIIAETRRSGRNYMMMETGAYTREYLYAKSLYDAGELGPVTFLRGTYYQDLEGDYPLYWKAQPPMHYATHVVGPILALMETRATKVHCLGAGVLRETIQQPGGNTFPLQTAIFRMEGTPAVAEVTRAWFQTARGYTESFSVYGEHRGFEWQQLEWEDPVVFTLPPNDPAVRWRDPQSERVAVPFRPDLLPGPLKRFADGGHGGSHPHLVHEFIRSIVEGRPAAINEIVSADWCAPGICANLSSLRDGASVEIPAFV